MRPCVNPALESRRRALELHIAAFLKSGKRIEQVLMGVSGERAITQPPQRRKGGPKQRAFVILAKDSRVR